MQFMQRGVHIMTLPENVGGTPPACMQGHGHAGDAAGSLRTAARPVLRACSRKRTLAAWRAVSHPRHTIQADDLPELYIRHRMAQLDPDNPDHVRQCGASAGLTCVGHAWC